MKEIYFVERSR